MHAEAMPISVEDPVWLKQRGDARARGTRQELEEWREVLCAHAFRGERRMEQGIRVGRGEAREVACGLECVGGGGRVQRVHAA